MAAGFRTGPDFVGDFDRYEAGFREFIRRKERSAERFASSFAPGTRVGLFNRNLVLRLASHSFVRNRLLRRLVADRFDMPEYPIESEPIQEQASDL